jgi:hypothetical protein
VTSVHHEGGDLFALQQVWASGDLLHRVSYEANGRVLEAMIAGGRIASSSRILRRYAHAATAKPITASHSPVTRAKPTYIARRPV